MEDLPQKKAAAKKAAKKDNGPTERELQYGP
jgi:hypothetical protein